MTVTTFDLVGKVETPPWLARHMVDLLFQGAELKPTHRVLDAGCGRGAFIKAIIDWSQARGLTPPEIVGVEIDQRLAEFARNSFRDYPNIRIICGDFLTIDEKEIGGKFDYIISNPPYISYEKIPANMRRVYRRTFNVATGRFDIYMLFFERGLSLLKPGGRLVFITPEKFLYVISAKRLRRLLSNYAVEVLEFVQEDAFGGVLAYPVITVVRNNPPTHPILVMLRDGTTMSVTLPSNGSPWLASIQRSYSRIEGGGRFRLGDFVLRISAGIATGLDKAFVVDRKELPAELWRYAYPTVSGRELQSLDPGRPIDYNRLANVLLLPYDKDGRLLDEVEAEPLLKYLSKWREELARRYAIRVMGKKWYSFHEEPPLRDLLRPKILCPDITMKPSFYLDALGKIIPRHSVYYIVPKNPSTLQPLLEYLNSREVEEWLRARCQRAANGYIRLQSHVLRNLPITKTLFMGATLGGGYNCDVRGNE